MCGIFAVSAAAGAPVDLALALAALHHRGPDGTGTWVSPAADCHFGHARLAIVDLSPTGHQPMVDAGGRFTVCYNGEIYNCPDLRVHLERRHGPIAWRGTSDTEVIVEGFAREGIEFLDRLNGMFALALYDAAERVMHVLRDPIGIKPLFVTLQRGAAYFASELKALLAQPAIERTLRREALAEQLAYMYVPEPLTPFEQVTKVDPGVCFTYREGRQVASRRLFEHLRPQRMFDSEGEASEALRATLADAVRRQLIADVPVSLFLSGGLDSSSVAHFAARAGATIKDAYTIAFSDDDRRLDAQGDDLHHARLMAAKLGIELKVITAGRDFMDMLPQLIRSMEDGFSDPAAINTYLICAGARRDGIKVLLSGQGADEYLGGYRRYLAAKTLQRVPAALRGALAAADRVLPAHLPGRFNALNRRLKRLSRLAGQAPGERLKAMYTWASDETVRSLLRDNSASPVDAGFAGHAAKAARPDILDTIQALDHRYDLLSLNLCYTDRMSMAAGVEARVPFLDLDLVRTMNAIPARMKVRGGQGKAVFKRAMRDILPHDIVYRAKAGFGLPLRAWLREGNDLVARLLAPARLRRQGLYDAEGVQRLLAAQFAGREDHTNTVFTLLTQQLWLEANHLG